MISYNDLYEILRKEKYSEILQALPKNFVEEFSEYLNDMKETSKGDQELFADSVVKSRKQRENAIVIFKELMLRRKKKLLNLVFVAAETGIMKRDYESMLEYEKKAFDKLVKAFEEGDKDLSSILNGQKGEEIKMKMVIFSQNVQQFVDHSGEVIGPYAKGEMANLDSEVSKILVSSGKANFVDED